MMSLKNAAVACLLSLGVSAPAFAGGAFVLGDAQMDAVTAAGTVTFLTDITKTVTINKTVNLDVTKNVTSTVDLEGSLATAEASADAIDFDNVLAETDTFAQVSELGAFSFSEALAAGINNPVVIPLP